MNEQDDDLIVLERDPKVVIRRDEQLATFPVPNMRVEFRILASWNDYLSVARHPGAAQGLMKHWRQKGEAAAISQARRDGFPIKTLTTYDATKTGRIKKTETEHIDPPAFTRCEMVLRYWRANWGIYDAFNPFIKPIIDGFVDAGLLYKDSQDYIPAYTVRFMGVDARLKLSDEAKQIRGIGKLTKRRALQSPARYWFDIYAL